MAENLTVARPYAEAAYKLAAERYAELGVDAAAAMKALAGIPLGNYDPAWKNVLLVGATEQRTDEEIDRFAAALGRVAK